MKAVLSTIALAAISHAKTTVSGDVMEAFNNFAKKYGKSYTDAEWPQRLSIFAENLEKVNKQNAEHLLAGGDAVFGITKFMDLTAAEFKSMYLTYIPSNATKAGVSIELDGPMAATVDWRTKGAVTEVKDQGQCGSCWAFSATEAIESYNFLAGNKLLNLSPQQITSCDKVDQGCNGGNTETAYQYVVKQGGIDLESEYPYTSGTGVTGICKVKTDYAATITGYTSITKGESNLQAALNNGPVSICLAAEAFQTYSSGILKVCPGQVDHCVQAVGYDSTNNYWLVRNSWATSWGEQGYIRIAMGKDLCKISDDATFPTF